MKLLCGRLWEPRGEFDAHPVCKLASLLYFILKLKLKGEKRHGTHYRGGIFQWFEIEWFQDLFTLESFSKLRTNSLNIIRPGFMFIVFIELSMIL